ncbi:MAG: cytochrome c3 family protein [Ignavibacteriae bacterium]|nr:cytochrome c3 family protein [Ignavibacteriota bacterium]
MKIIKLYIFLFIVSSTTFGQITNLKTHAQMDVDCKKCHICDTPTKANPCLIACPRNKSDIIRHSPDEGPNEIYLAEIKVEKDLYKPVKFSHKLHSEMSLMSGGCVSCHHFNPPGKIVKCVTCHEPERSRTNLSTPDLKAALHRQCIGCHSTWEEKTECKSCHLLNTEKKSDSKKVKSAENVHPKITIPAKIVYETKAKEGKFVTYFHNDHSSLFGLECNACHTQESCANCHNKKEKFVADKKADKHSRCSSCHKTDNQKTCNQCHQNSEAKPFDHKLKTGFAVTGYHNISDCSQCHKEKNKFTGLKQACVYCHKNNDGVFDHNITGLKLDDIHIEFYCENCHAKNNYTAKPTCDECHDDVSYPDDLPGEKIK